MSRLALGWAMSLVTLVGCERCNRASVADAGDVAIPAIDASTEAAADAHADAAAPHAKVPTPEERKTYDAALKRGRAATVAKKYPDAIAAFGEALKAIPSDARATSERGYARFLSGDIAGAEKDFNSAIDEVPKSDRKLTAQIYYNLGLAAEKRGDSGAGAYFRSSYEYNPTAAAKSKMSTCPVTLGGPFEIDSVATTNDYEPSGPLDEEQRVLQPPDAVTHAPGDLDDKAQVGALLSDESAHALLPKPSGGYWRFDANAKLRQTLMSGLSATNDFKTTRSTQDKVEIVREGSLWIITTQPMVLAPFGECPCGGCDAGEMVRNNQDPGSGDMKCEDSPFPSGDGYCIPCGGTIDHGVGVEPTLMFGGSREIFYVDATTGAALWDVSYDIAFEKTVKLAIEGGKLRITGEGCDITTPRR